MVDHGANHRVDRRGAWLERRSGPTAANMTIDTTLPKEAMPVCTQQSANDVTVCDVAVDDVRRSLDGFGGISFEPTSSGTRVLNHDDYQTERFRTRVAAAIGGHGGRLAPIEPGADGVVTGPLDGPFLP